MEQISLNAYAKINLYLDITGKCDNGYHTVNTVMQTITLCDRVTVKKTEDNQITVQCDNPNVPTDGRNLVVKAANAYFETVGKRHGVYISIAKHIPMAAGLAGGSTDAAATLMALNQMNNEPMSLAELLALGGTLGADVPFCMVGGTCYADGFGEQLHEFPSMPQCHLVVACGGEGVSTPWAYGMLDRKYGDFAPNCYTARNPNALHDAIEKQDLRLVSANMYNIFEDIILPERPVAIAIRDTMCSHGAIGVMMSGSGPSVFGVFADDQKAMDTVKALATQEIQGFLTMPQEKKCRLF